MSDTMDTLAERAASALAKIRSIVAETEAFDPGVPTALVEAGLHLAPLPVADGGLGAGLADSVALIASVGAVDGSAALGYAMHVHVVGSATQGPGWASLARERLVAAVRDEGGLVNSAATEARGGSPARGAIPETVAEPDGDGYRLTGEKAWTTWLPALRLASVTASVARQEPPVLGTFLVDLDQAGVERLPAFDALGMRGSASGRLRLTDVAVEAADVVGLRGMDEADPRGSAPGAWFAACVAGAYLGVGEGARSRVARWALERRPGDGASAVADLPTVRVRLGRLDAALRAARIVLLATTRRWDEAAPGGRAALLGDLQLAKLQCTAAAGVATDQALRIAGGPGLLAGPLERAFRDARAGLVNPPLEDVAYQGFAAALLEREGAADPDD
jgi:alkylation response protein AidB-like acyl-CoA dehydrogenase